MDEIDGGHGGTTAFNELFAEAPIIIVLALAFNGAAFLFAHYAVHAQSPRDYIKVAASFGVLAAVGALAYWRATVFAGLA